MSDEHDKAFYKAVAKATRDIAAELESQLREVEAERDRLEAENERLREALLNMRSDLREMAERESGNSLYRHFYFRCDEALATTEGSGEG